MPLSAQLSTGLIGGNQFRFSGYDLTEGKKRIKRKKFFSKAEAVMP